MGDPLDEFNLQLAELINKATIPISAIKLCLQNSLLQLDIIKLQSIINETNETQGETEEIQK